MTDPSHSVAPHPAAPHHLPFFITPAGQTDVLLIAMIIFLLVMVVVIGNLYFKLHALPERMAHRGHHVQMQLVAVLTLLALFTHNHAFWIAALLLAMVHLPDFSTPINSIAQSLERLVGAGTKADLPAASVPAANIATGDGSHSAVAYPPPPISGSAASGPVAALAGASLAPPSTAAQSEGVKRLSNAPEQKRA